MGAQENIKAVQNLVKAVQQRDEGQLRELYTEDAVLRVAGVPRALGGVSQGREQILANLRQQGAPTGEAQVRSIFSDDKNVCAVLKVSGPFNGTQQFKGTGRPFTSYEAILYGLEGGRIREQTVYMNFLDVYVQAGLVPLNSLVASA